MSIESIAFIGCGNMASSVARALYKQLPELKYFTFTPSKTRALSLANEIKGSLLANNQADVYIIGCKPQQYQDFAKDFKEKIPQSAIIISLLAATPIDVFKRDFPTQHLIRFLPNIPIEFGLGTSLIYFQKEEESELKEVLSILAHISKNFTLSLESDLEKLTVISSSGPAYFLEIAKNMANSLDIESLDRKDIEELVLRTMQGAALMPANDKLAIDELIAKVTSKGGVTIEAINEFRSLGLSNIIKSGVVKAHKRAIEIIKLIHASN